MKELVGRERFEAFMCMFLISALMVVLGCMGLKPTLMKGTGITWGIFCVFVILSQVFYCIERVKCNYFYASHPLYVNQESNFRFLKNVIYLEILFSLLIVLYSYFEGIGLSDIKEALFKALYVLVVLNMLVFSKKVNKIFRGSMYYNIPTGDLSEFGNDFKCASCSAEHPNCDRCNGDLTSEEMVWSDEDDGYWDDLMESQQGESPEDEGFWDGVMDEDKKTDDDSFWDGVMEEKDACGDTEEFVEESSVANSEEVTEEVEKGNC